MIHTDELVKHYSGFTNQTVQNMEKLLRESRDLNDLSTPDVRLSLEALRQVMLDKNIKSLPN
jgi:hypothetical protein